MELRGSGGGAGKKLMAPSASPPILVPPDAATAAIGVGQPQLTSNVYISSAPRTQNAPCDKLITPVTRKTRENPSAMTAKTAPCNTPPSTIWIAKFILLAKWESRGVLRETTLLGNLT